MKIEKVEELLPPKPKSYRKVIVDFINSDMRKGKITIDLPSRAKDAARILRGWVGEDEHIKVVQDGRTIYLIKMVDENG